MQVERKRVLVVDNEPDVLEAIVASLELSGYAVIAADSPLKALELCEQQPVDVAIIDFIMPKMDGLQLLARIRQIRPLVRSIIISGQIASSTDAREISEILKERVEADWYLEKPVDGTILEATIEELLANQPSAEWKEIGGRMVKGQSAKIKAAEEAARLLKRHKPKKK